MNEAGRDQMWPSPEPDHPSPEVDSSASEVGGSVNQSMGEQQAQTSVTGVPPSTASFERTPQAAVTSAPGMSTMAPVTVENPSASPKTPLILSGVMAGLGALALLIAAMFGAAGVSVFDDISTEAYTKAIGDSANLTYEDADGAGEEGWYLLIPGDPNADTDDNGIIDACEGVNFTITDASGTDVSERMARISCSTDAGDRGSNAGEPYFDIDDHVVVARMCHTLEKETARGSWEQEHSCTEDEVFTVSNDANITMSVVDLDAMYIPLITKAAGWGGGAFASGAAGCCSLCGGLIALFVGLVRLQGNKKQPAMQFIMQ